MSSPGDEIAGRYRLEELLGGGQGAEVWRALDTELGRTVAVKLLTPTADPERFRREAQSVASLAHHNVMQLFDYGEVDGRPFMVLEYLPGGTLAERLRPGEPLATAAVEPIAAGIAAGLAHAHERGIVHRDLKPANILFDEEGRPKLADFGIARRAAGEGTLTEAGTVLGTASYISPEQAAGEPAGPPSDVYALGVILFQLLSGRLPFEADDALTLAELHRDEPPPPVAPVAADVPPGLVALTGRMLAKDPADRPADGAAALAALAATTVDQPTGVTRALPAVAPPPAAGARRPRRVALVVAALLLIALAGAGLAWAVTRPDGQAPHVDSTPAPPVTAKKHRTTSTGSTTTPTTFSTSSTTSTTGTTATTRTHPTTTRRTTTAPATTTVFTTTTTLPTTATTTTGATGTGTTTATTPTTGTTP